MRCAKLVMVGMSSSSAIHQDGVLRNARLAWHSHVTRMVLNSDHLHFYHVFV